MLKMIRQFTFHHPKQIIAPTLWLFLSQAFSILPAIGTGILPSLYAGYCAAD